MNSPTRTCTLFALLVAALCVAGYTCHSALSLRAVHAAGASGPQPIQFPGFPYKAAVIDGWVATGNTAAMRRHGWDLWAGLSAITSNTGGQPTYETWYNASQVQSGPQQANALAVPQGSDHAEHQFAVPEQFHHRRFPGAVHALVAGATDVHAQTLVTTKFNAEYAQSIWSNNYQTPATVWNLQASWGQRPVSQRIIQPFTPPSISLKPTYQFVNGPNHNNGLTTIKYWLGDLTTGPTNSSNPQYPDPTTWNQCVVVNTGSAPNPGNLTCFGTNTLANGMVPVSQFYNYQLSATEAASACAQLNSPQTPMNCDPTNGDIRGGDYAILVGMHVSTKENANWTWQTFWWNYNQPFPYGAPPSNVPAPFSSYAMCTGYSMTVNPPNSPSGVNTQCYNPYLETGLPAPIHGIKSDCMSCHSVASIGNNPNSLSQQPISPRNSGGYLTYVSGTSYVSVWNRRDDRDFFDCQTTTDFSWFLANLVAGSTPSNQAPCVLTAAQKNDKKKK